MKSAGVLVSNAREHGAVGASLAAMLFVMFASTLAAAQSSADTAASETWKSAAASASAASPAVASSPGAAMAEAAAPVPSRPVVAPSGYSGKDAMPSNMVPDTDSTQPGTAEIPAANSADASQQQPPGTAPDSQPADAQSSNDGSEVARYQEEQSGMPPEQLKALQEFDSEGELSTPFGMQLREAKRTLKSGEDADGLLIMAVEKNSPAAAVGLRPYTHGVHDAIAAAAMVGAVFSGGLSVVIIPALDYMQVGESYDMIIGVDGSRVTNFLDFQDRMRDLQPGEVVYLSVLRDGKRLQLTMPVTANVVQATN
jgi:hypothetical protein